MSNAMCRELIVAGEVAASARGWSTGRHAKYATTDLAVREVPALWALVEPHMQALVDAGISLQHSGTCVDCPDMVHGNDADLEFHEIFLIR
jgi:hypothetical protein